MLTLRQRAQAIILTCIAFISPAYPWSGHLNQLQPPGALNITTSSASSAARPKLAPRRSHGRHRSLSSFKEGSVPAHLSYACRETQTWAHSACAISGKSSPSALAREKKSQNVEMSESSHYELVIIRVVLKWNCLRSSSSTAKTR